VVRRLILSYTGVTLIALYPCSMQASVTTDGNGRIVGLSSVCVGSKLSNWPVETLVIDGQLAVELRRIRPGGTVTRAGTDCPVADVSDGLIASLA